MNVWLQILGSSGLAAVIVVMVNAVVNRRNLGAQTARTDSETHRTDAETDELIRSTYGNMLADVRARLDGALQRVNEVEAQNAVMRNTMTGVISDRDDLVRWINGVLLPWVKAGAKPPAPDVPKHLADVLPQWVPVILDDGDDPPPIRRKRP